MSEAMRHIRELADRLTIEVDPDYKTEWERGYDFGQMAAGQALMKLLDQMPSPEEIDTEALRIANSRRAPNAQLQFLSTMAPHAQGRYRELAKKNLRGGV